MRKVIKKICILVFKNNDQMGFSRVISNIGWLWFDKFLRMGVGIIIAAWVARYLGPSSFGLLNYAMAFTAIAGVLASLGIDNIVVRELVLHPEKEGELLGSAFCLKLFGGCLIAGLTLVTSLLINQENQLLSVLIGIISTGFIVQSLFTIDLFFQSKVLSKFTVWCQNISFVLVSIGKVVLILFEKDLIWFALIGVLELLIAGILLVYFYQKNNYSVIKWRFEKSVAMELARTSVPLLLSSLAIIIYMKVDQIFVGKMLDAHSVGIYSAASKITELWYFIPMTIVPSLYPIIISMRSSSPSLYYHRLQLLFDGMTLLSIVIVLPVFIFADQAVSLLFGDSYVESGKIVVMHIWSALFVFLSTASGHPIIAENRQTVFLGKTLMGAFASILLNWLLIPIAGLSGAAIATVIASGVATFSIGLFPSTRPMFKQLLKSLLLHKAVLRLWNEVNNFKNNSV